VLEIQVKRADPASRWIWGAFKMPGSILRSLHDLWLARDRSDEYMGTLVNAWLERGGRARGVPAGSAYVDVGTLNGYREALQLLAASSRSDSALRVEAIARA
jgi:glucose-1-phosphate thymidylyltransferase